MSNVRPLRMKSGMDGQTYFLCYAFFFIRNTRFIPGCHW